MTDTTLDVTTPNAFVVRAVPVNSATINTSGHAVILAATPGPPGPPGPAGTGFPVVGETPAGVINGSNATFTTSQPFQSGTTAVYLNGLREDFYSESGNSTVILGAPPTVGDKLRIDYTV